MAALPEPEEVAEAVELNLNRRLVALDDLAALCAKYAIPPEEVVCIIERGYGFQVSLEGDDTDDDR